MKRTLLLAAIGVAFAGAVNAATTELVIYRDSQFRGPAQTIKGEVANIENGFGHEASSLIARGGAWEVCTRDHFQGRCRTLAEGEYPTLGGLNDRIVSVRFLGARANVTRNDAWQERGRNEARDTRPDWRGREAAQQDARERDEVAARWRDEDRAADRRARER